MGEGGEEEEIYNESEKLSKSLYDHKKRPVSYLFLCGIRHSRAFGESTLLLFYIIDTQVDILFPLSLHYFL